MGSSTGSLLVHEDDVLRRVLGSGRRRVAVPSENEARLRARFALIRDGGQVAQHPERRDVETAVRPPKPLPRPAPRAAPPIHAMTFPHADDAPLLAAPPATP